MNLSTRIALVRDQLTILQSFAPALPTPARSAAACLAELAAIVELLAVKVDQLEKSGRG